MEKHGLSREEKVRVVETYLDGLAGKDLSQVPFAVDVTFEGPRVPPLTGRPEVVRFLSMIGPAIRSIQIGEHLVEEDFVATTFDMETSDGRNRVFDRIHIVNGEIKSIQSFYYPQPSH
jgi:SnoaL-like domain